MMNGHNKTPPPPPPPASTPPMQLAEAKLAAAENGEYEQGMGFNAGVVGSKTGVWTRGDVLVVTLRVLCMGASLTAMSFMVTARQVSTASFYGFQLHLHSKWSFSYSFEYLVGVTAAAAGYSFLQLLIGGSRLLRKSSVIPSRNQAWFIFAGDQIMAYAMMSAGSAASGVSNLNRTGIRHTALPNFCKSLDSFCDHVAVSIAFTFFTCVLYAASAVLDGSSHQIFSSFMAYHLSFGSSLYPKLPSLKPKSRNPFFSSPSISCQIYSFKSNNSDDDDKTKKTQFNFLALPLTLTIISTSFPQKSCLAAVKASDRKKTQKKTQEALTPEQLKQWSKNLPIVTDRIPYTEILSLKHEGKLKHLIKPPSASLKQRAEPVLVVLEDSRVLRTVLPSINSDRKFWDSWDELKIESLCVNAYTPPIKRPEVPAPYLGFLWKVPTFMLSQFKPKESKRALEMRRAREEFKRQQKEELARMKEERLMIEKAMKVKKKEEERRKKREIRKRKQDESLHDARRNYQDRAKMWARLAYDSNVATALGLVFFVIFYQTVVLNYKRQKKDYEDRLKIEKEEAEERRKMRELDKEMQEIEGEDDESEQAGGEENPNLKMAMQFMKSGARVRRANYKRLPQYLERGVDVKFSDVAGLGKIRLELEEIVKFFTHGEIYRRRGVRIPGGILLCGPPGVGKTLLAKAVAGEAGVNFFSISASQFVEIYVGVGASRVRSLYQEAKENAPSVVFIDELDAVGRERGLIKGSGGQERDATLNQLLVCLDGFEGRGNVITIASTNRPDILDPALVRPGRFDRKIFIPRPGLIGRMEILQVHARKKPMAEDVDYMAVASITDGMVGAELANILEVAAINMIRDGRTEITTDDLLQAAQIEERGLLDKKERSPEAWKQIAINEAAMAVAAVNFPDFKNIEFITISPRAGRELGYARMKTDNIKFQKGMLSRQSLLDYITVQLAPRAADELWFGEGQLSTIWAESADIARSAARKFVLGGLSEKHYGMSNFWLADRINEIDLEALRILNMCYERAKEILQQNRKLLDAVVDELAEKKSLTKEEFSHLVELHASLKPMPPSILDIRAAKRAQFQEMMMNQKVEIATAMNVLGSVEASKQFTVGDHKGWQQPGANDSAFYSHWASRKRFHVGDSLSFEYQNDSVLVVEKWDYYHCNTNKPIFSFTDGNTTVVNLDRPGLFYFISGAVDHCRSGQKLLIRVMGLHQKPDQSPPSVAAPPGADIAPGPHHSSGLVVTVTLSSVFVALMVTVIILVLKEQGKNSGQSSDENEGP
ncbi:Peptidase M41 [Corchorus capsularis]|uniref:Peptidase M41 n=1 Tax=Corchorus capsularis TaxID=210143 RepID=A0A1R3G7F6_COCAP|nr:Peptidase M41 [Corchorus capsularis]